MSKTSNGDTLMVDEKYTLTCLDCGRKISDCYTNSCSNHNSLLRTEYQKKKLTPRKLPGMWKFIDWLPVAEPLKEIDTSPITYKSETFAKEFGLSNLYISFSGYWPERKANIKTCSFKELEAPPTFQRAAGKGILVVASTGNTGRAFANVASKVNQPIVAIIPKSYLHRMWSTEELNDVLLISVDGAYSDAIKVAGKIATSKQLLNEGGVRNVARRDGLGVILLNSLLLMKRLPDFYFQAVGTGTGVIATWEASIRALKDGRFGDRLPRLCPSQNEPFAPMYYAWKAKRREIIPEKDMPDFEKSIDAMYANILSSMSPAYSIKGGIYEAVTKTNGKIYGVTNEKAEDAEKLFENAEGIDLDPAASVAVASLIEAVENRTVLKKDMVLLNISGGGFKRIRKDYTLHLIKPCLSVEPETRAEQVQSEVNDWLGSLDQRRCA